MKCSLLKIVLSLVFIIAAQSSYAQVSTYPSGGLTIKTLQVADTGWVFVEFEEQNTVIDNNCAAANTLFGTHPKVLWIKLPLINPAPYDPNATNPTQPEIFSSHKELYAQLLAMQMAGRPISGLTLYDMGTYCSLYAVQTTP